MGEAEAGARRRRRLRPGLGQLDVHLLDRLGRLRPARGAPARRGRSRAPGAPHGLGGGLLGVLPAAALLFGGGAPAAGRASGGRRAPRGRGAPPLRASSSATCWRSWRELHLVHGRLALQLEDARLERLDLLLAGVVAGRRADPAQPAAAGERDEEEGEALHRVPAFVAVRRLGGGLGGLRARA